MHIKPIQAINAYQEQSLQTRKLDATKKSNHTQQPDEVILSNRGAEIGSVVNQIRETSDVRMELVKEFSQKVESGNYYINSYDIASKFVGSNSIGLFE